MNRLTLIACACVALLVFGCGASNDNTPYQGSVIISDGVVSITDDTIIILYAAPSEDEDMELFSEQMMTFAEFALEMEDYAETNRIPVFELHGDESVTLNYRNTQTNIVLPENQNAFVFITAKPLRAQIMPPFAGPEQFAAFVAQNN